MRAFCKYPSRSNKTNPAKCIAMSLCLLVAGFAFALGAQAAPIKKLTAIPPVPNPCPRYNAGATIQEAPNLFSQNGSLNVSFSYQTVTDSAGRQLFCFMTPNGLQNPTLNLFPGEVLTVTITNNTPAGMNPMELAAPNCPPGETMMNSASVNMHFHGTNVSPACGSDEVIKTVINPTETFTYTIAFPANEPPGLYWYHPHVHGISEHAVLGGAAGALIIEGIEQVQPIVAGLPQHTLVIKDQRQLNDTQEQPGPCVNGIPFQDISVNDVPIDSYQAHEGGAVTFSPAVMTAQPNERQFWRVSNSSADTILNLRYLVNNYAATMVVVAIDGVPVNSQDGSSQSAPINVEQFRLPSASRVEFLIQTPSFAPGTTVQLQTTAVNTGPAGDCDPTRPIFNLVQGPDPAKAKMLLQTAHKVSGRRFAGLRSMPIQIERLLDFSEEGDQFYMTVHGQTPAVFNPNQAPAIIATAGTVEQWTVENLSTENHEFHIHQTHFLVQSQNNFETNGWVQAPAINNQYLDMIEVPAWDGNPNHPFPSVTLLMDFRTAYIGNFVFHCHILNHEDQGMMNIIQVKAALQKKRSPVHPGKASTPPTSHSMSASSM